MNTVHTGKEDASHLRKSPTVGRSGLGRGHNMPDYHNPERETSNLSDVLREGRNTRRGKHERV